VEIVNYSALLAQRARYAYPLDLHEHVATQLGQRNQEALIAWRIRWAQRCELIDAYPDTRQLRNDSLSLKRYFALEWLVTKNTPVKRLRVVK